MAKVWWPRWPQYTYSNKLTDLLNFIKAACHTSVQQSAQLTDLLNKRAHPATNLELRHGPNTSKYHKETDSLVGPGTTSYRFHAGTTVPNAHSSSLHLGL